MVLRIPAMEAQDFPPAGRALRAGYRRNSPKRFVLLYPCSDTDDDCLDRRAGARTTFFPALQHLPPHLYILTTSGENLLSGEKIARRDMDCPGSQHLARAANCALNGGQGASDEASGVAGGYEFPIGHYCAYHSFARKHLQRNVDEFAFWLNAGPCRIQTLCLINALLLAWLPFDERTTH